MAQWWETPAPSLNPPDPVPHPASNGLDDLAPMMPGAQDNPYLRSALSAYQQMRDQSRALLAAPVPASAAPPVEPPKPEEGWISKIGGTILTPIAETLTQLGPALYNVADAATGGYLDEGRRRLQAGAQNLLGDDVRWQDIPTMAGGAAHNKALLMPYESAGLQAGRQQLSQAQGVGESLKTVATNPYLLTGMVAESLPWMIGIAGPAKAAATAAFEGALAKGATQAVAEAAAKTAATRASIAGNFAISGGTSGLSAQERIYGMSEAELANSPAYQQLRQQGFDHRAAQEALARSANVKTTAVAGTLGAGATALLGGGLESQIAQRLAGVAGPSQGVVKNILGGAARESGEEYLQSGGERLGENVGLQAVNPTTPLLNHVFEDAAVGALVGAVAGGTFGALGDTDRTRQGRAGQDATHRADLARLALAHLDEPRLAAAAEQARKALADNPKMPARQRQALESAIGHLDTDLQGRANGEGLRQVLADPAQLQTLRGQATLAGMADDARVGQLSDEELLTAAEQAVQMAQTPALGQGLQQQFTEVAQAYAGHLKARQQLANLDAALQADPTIAPSLAARITQAATGQPKKGITPEYSRASLDDTELTRHLTAAERLLGQHGGRLNEDQRASLTEARAALQAEREQRAANPDWQARNAQIMQANDPREVRLRQAFAKNPEKTVARLTANDAPLIDTLIQSFESRAQNYAQTGYPIPESITRPLNLLQARKTALETDATQKQQAAEAKRQADYLRQQKSPVPTLADALDLTPTNADPLGDWLQQRADIADEQGQMLKRAIAALQSPPTNPEQQRRAEEGRRLIAARLEGELLQQGIEEQAARAQAQAAVDDWIGSGGQSGQSRVIGQLGQPLGDPRVQQGRQELSRLLGPAPAPQTAPVAPASQPQSLADFLTRDSTAGNVPPAPTRAEGPIATPATPAPRPKRTQDEIKAMQGKRPATPAPKEPWQMTQAEFLAEVAAQSRQRQAALYAEGLQILEDLKHRMTPQQRQSLQKRYQQVADAHNLDVNTSGFTEDEIRIHQEWIQGALNRGKPVPAEVLADYPHLQAASKTSAPTPSSAPQPQSETAREKGQTETPTETVLNPPSAPEAPAKGAEAKKEPEVPSSTPVADSDPFAAATREIDLSPETLTGYRNTAGWAERGGRLLRDESGQVTGRTKWLPRSEWWAAYKASGKGTLSETAAKAALQAALDGQPLTAKQQALLEFLADYEAANQQRNAESQWIEDQLSTEEQALLDRLETALAEHPAFGRDRLAEFLERISQKYESITPAQFGRALIKSYEAKLHELQQAESGGRTERTAGRTESTAEGAPGPAGEGAGLALGETPLLTDYTLAELDAENARVQAAIEQQRQADAAAEAKRQADREVGGFTLTGSNRPADVAMSQGQTSLLDTMDGKTGNDSAAKKEAALATPEEAAPEGASAEAQQRAATQKDIPAAPQGSPANYADVNALRQARKDGQIDTPALIKGMAQQVVSGAIPIGKLFGNLQAFDDWSEGDVAMALREAGMAPDQLAALGYAAEARRPAPKGSQKFAAASTPAAVTNSLQSLTGDRLVQDLIDAGTLRVVARQAQLPASIVIPAGQRVAGAVDPETGQVYLIAENIAPDEIAGFLTHEVGVHQAQLGLNQPKSRALRLAHALTRLVGARQILGEPSFNDALAQLQRMRATSKPVQAAYAAAQQAMGHLNQNPALLHEEALAYLVQNHPKTSLAQQIIAAVRAFLYKAGLKINLTENDLQALAVAALRGRAGTKPASSAREVALQRAAQAQQDLEAARQYADVVARYTNPDGSKKAGWMKAPNGEPTKLTERQWVQVRTENFKQWFGDWENDPENSSKVIDDNGEPRVVYHGTGASSFSIFDTNKQRALLNRKFQGDGFAFTDMPIVAEEYATANRNQTVSRDAFLGGIRSRYPLLYPFARTLIDQGYESAWEQPERIIQLANRYGIDANDIGDLAEYVEGSATARNEAGHLFGGVQPMPEWVHDTAARLGIDTPSPNLIPVFLSLKNPLVTNNQGKARHAKAKGSDGLIYSGEGTVRGYPEYIVFSPTQIKSAIGNTGAFSPGNADIRFAYSLGQAEPNLTAEEVLQRIEAGGEVTAEEFALLQAYLSGASRAVPATGVDAPSFKNWFGASKIKGKTGQPLKMYHGTATDFTVFEAATSGASTQHPTAALGFFFTNDRAHAAEKYGDRVMEVYLAIEKPYVMTDADLRQIESREDALAFRRKLEAQGYDGVALPAETKTRYVVAFRPDQIKFTTNETYTRGENDIRFAKTSERAMTTGILSKDYKSAFSWERNDDGSFRVDYLESDSEIARKRNTKLGWAKFSKNGELIATGTDWLSKPSRNSLDLAQIEVNHLVNIWKSPLKSFYFRFGDLPKDLKSKHAISGKKEKGVSVYTATPNVWGIYALDDSIKFPFYGMALLDRPAYEISGKVVGYGADGEPLLKDAKIVREIGIKEIKSLMRIQEDNTNKISDTRFAIATPNPRPLTPAQQAAMDKIGRREPQGWGVRFAGLRDRIGLKLRQAIADHHAALLDLDRQAYGEGVVENQTAAASWVKARLSRSVDGPMHLLLHESGLRMDADGALDVLPTVKGLQKVLAPLGTEVDDFLKWVAGNRAERLMQEGRENLFTPTDITALKTLNQGTMADGRNRATVYASVLKDFVALQKSVMDIAEQSGLIDGNERHVWEHDFYVPFYRLAEDTQDVRSINAGDGLVRQEAFKKLKGGKDRLNDLLENTVMNWQHLLSASLKNNAARQALTNAQRVRYDGIPVAEPINPAKESTKGAVYYRQNGQPQWFRVNDPLVLEAITALDFNGLKGPVMSLLRKARHLLTRTTTISPAFKVANLLRDTVQTLAVSQASAKTGGLGNIVQGWKNYAADSAIRQQMLAGGGAFLFGSTLEDHAEAMKKLLAKGVRPATILDTPAKLWEVLSLAYWKYEAFGDRLENANRAALYEQLRKQGKSHLYASFQARDLLDFSQSGASGAVRFLTAVVPFLNARIQGLDKLGRAASQSAQRGRFAVTLAAVTLASAALYLLYKDDDDFKQREEWDRDTYWWFKIGDTAFRIPKPFEVGALATLLGDRVVEQIVDQEATPALYLDRLKQTLTQTFSVSMPQLFAPAVDVWRNRGSFTQRPIETLAQQRLSPELRQTASTSDVARGVSAASQGFLSPVQADYLIAGYFGWVGRQAVLMADHATRPLTDRPSPERLPVISDLMQRFVPTEQGGHSKYLTRFYEVAKTTEQHYADINELVKRGEIDAAKALVQRHREDLTRLKIYRKASTQLNDWNNQLKLLADLPASQISAEQRQRARETLQAAKLRMAQAVMEGQPAR